MACLFSVNTSVYLEWTVNVILISDLVNIIIIVLFRSTNR